MPKISVIIPTYNRARMLETAIESVLAQTDVDFEIIVSDNCSEDDTQAVVQKFLHDPRILYFRNERNLGMVGNWKTAIFERSRADWFVLMSDDDYLTDTTYLSRAERAILEHNPVFVYAGGVVQDVVANTSEVLRLPFDGLVPGAQVFASRGTVFPQDAILCNIVFNKTAAARLGFLSNPNNLSCDSELYLMLCAEGDVYAIADPVCVYFKHGSNIVDKIAKNRVFLDNNMDFLVKPYAYAKQRKMDQACVSEFLHNTRLEQSVSSTLLKLGLHNASWFQTSRNRIRSLAPELVNKIESSFSYKCKRVILSLGRSYFQAKYPLNDGQSAKPV